MRASLQFWIAGLRLWSAGCSARAFGGAFTPLLSVGVPGLGNAGFRIFESILYRSSGCFQPDLCLLRNAINRLLHDVGHAFLSGLEPCESFYDVSRRLCHVDFATFYLATNFFHVASWLERVMGIEPATFCLGSRSTQALCFRIWGVERSPNC